MKATLGYRGLSHNGLFFTHATYSCRSAGATLLQLLSFMHQAKGISPSLHFIIAEVGKGEHENCVLAFKTLA